MTPIMPDGSHQRAATKVPPSLSAYQGYAYVY